MSGMGTIDSIKSECNVYLNERYVFKKCCDVSRKDKSRKWLVILEKLPETKTNEDRDTFDSERAKFRASCLKVIRIININDPTLTIEHLLNKFKGKETKYIVGKTICPDQYDQNINTVCSGGIHYFKTIEPAIVYIEVPKKMNGSLTRWYDDGQKWSEGLYVDGKESGPWTGWYVTGQKKYEGVFVDGKQSGPWTEWYVTGQKKYEGLVVDGNESGSWTAWHENGEKKSEGVYMDGMKSGQWTEWHENGKKRSEGVFVNGEKSGPWTEWDRNGQKQSEGPYVDGEKSGPWIGWDENGQKSFEYVYYASKY